MEGNHSINLINWKTRETGEGNWRLLFLFGSLSSIQLLIRYVNLTEKKRDYFELCKKTLEGLEAP